MSGPLFKILVSVGGCLALFGAIAVLALKLQRDRVLNLVLGAGLVVLAVAGGAYLALQPTVAAGTELPQRYVAYFDNAGGIEPGDIVRIKGRRAGKVVSTQVVRRDDRVMIRVEFEIAPGSGSQWLKQGGLPADSAIRVRTPSLLGRPTLSIEIGESSEVIELGGEWRKAYSASQDDQFSQWLAKLREFDRAIDRYMGYVRPEQIAEVKVQVARIRAMLDSARRSVEGAVEYAPNLRQRIQELGRAVESMLAQVRESSAGVTTQVEALSDGLAKAPEQMASASSAVRDLGELLSRVNRGLDQLRGQIARGETTKALLGMRKFSAQVRAGAVRGEYNPKNAGDMPPWRISRRYFNGGDGALEAADTADAAGAHQKSGSPLRAESK